MRESNCYFIRTKALQDHSYLTQFKGDSVEPISPKAYAEAIAGHPRRQINDGDVLYARGGSVGEVGIADRCGTATISSHVIRLIFAEHPWYCFAFMKHPICKLQQEPHQRGAIRALDNFRPETLLECLLPFPNQPDQDSVIHYVSALAEAIFDKEAAIRARHSSIMTMIEEELCSNSTGHPFQYDYPNLARLKATGRMDTGLHCKGFSRFKHKIDSYRHGATCLSQLGITSRRGPNLAVSVIGRSMYCDEPRNGWYELIRPVNIGEYGTLVRREWFGTKKLLPLVQRGDLILGCEGFEKGRTLVILKDMERCTTNFHGTVLSWLGADLWQIVFVRCYLAYLRESGVVDWVGVGGSGGHMSPEYFDYLPFPRFPGEKQMEIARLYHNPLSTCARGPDITHFAEWHRRHNRSLGIAELDAEAQALKQVLREVQDQIIEGRRVTLPGADGKE